jgi:hypothetical protein
MWQDGVEKARVGLTTLEEIAAATFVVQVDEMLSQSRLVA